jgi:hypothetical protein
LVSALQLHQEGQIPAPDPTVTLCFGEELHDLSNAKNKLILVQVRPLTSITSFIMWLVNNVRLTKQQCRHKSSDASQCLRKKITNMQPIHQ